MSEKFLLFIVINVVLAALGASFISPALTIPYFKVLMALIGLRIALCPLETRKK